MNLQDEYYTRHGIRGCMVDYATGNSANEAMSTILMAKKPEEVDYPCLLISITFVVDNRERDPGHFMVRTMSSPTVYISPDQPGSITITNQKPLSETRVEFDDYEAFLIGFAQRHQDNYKAIRSTEANGSLWLVFLRNFDSWLANCVPPHQLCIIAESIRDHEKIFKVEEWMKNSQERVFQCWKTLKSYIDSNIYADWFAQLINNDY